MVARSSRTIVAVCVAAFLSAIYMLFVMPKLPPTLRVGDCSLREGGAIPASVSRGVMSFWFVWPSMAFVDLTLNPDTQNRENAISVDIRESLTSSYAKHLEGMLKGGKVSISEENGMWAYRFKGDEREPFFFLSNYKYNAEIDAKSIEEQQGASLIRCHQLLNPSTGSVERILSCGGYFPIANKCMAYYQFRPDIRSDRWDQIEPLIRQKLSENLDVHK